MERTDQITLIAVDASMQPLVSHIAVGSDPALDAQLIQKSRQPKIMQYTPNDAKQRFGDAAMLQQWRAKGREIHWLLGPDNDLAGIIWYGKSTFPLDIELPEVPEETFAIRLYDGYTGHGLARPFMKQSLKLFVQAKQQVGEKIPGIWLQTDIANEAARRAYTKLGYREVAHDDTRITLVLTANQILDIVQA